MYTSILQNKILRYVLTDGEKYRLHRRETTKVLGYQREIVRVCGRESSMCQAGNRCTNRPWCRERHLYKIRMSIKSLVIAVAVFLFLSLEAGCPVAQASLKLTLLARVASASASRVLDSQTCATRLDSVWC